MDIHVVRAGETVSSVAARYGVPAGILAGVNGIAPDAPLAVGQTLVVRHPRELHTVASGESVYSIALRYGLSVRTLYQNNPALGGRSALYPGQTLVIAYDDAPLRTLAVNAYSYPFIRGGLLDAVLRRLDALPQDPRDLAHRPPPVVGCRARRARAAQPPATRRRAPCHHRSLPVRGRLKPAVAQVSRTRPGPRGCAGGPS